MRLHMIFLLASTLTACGTAITYTPLNSPPPGAERVPPEQVRVFMAKAPPDEYVEVGLLEAQQQSVWSLDAQAVVLEKMKLQASEVGCHAIAILGPNDRTVVSGSRYGVTASTLRGYRASCLVKATK